MGGPDRASERDDSVTTKTHNGVAELPRRCPAASIPLTITRPVFLDQGENRTDCDNQLTGHAKIPESRGNDPTRVGATPRTKRL